MNGVIYKYTNLLNGKVYIGQTIEPHKRCITHVWTARKGNGSYLHRAMRKYGSENFSYEVIDQAVDKLSLDSLEQHYIRLYESHFLEGNGYNLTLGGEGTVGYKHTETAKQKFREHRHTQETKSLLRNIRSGGKTYHRNKKENECQETWYTYSARNNRTKSGQETNF